MKEADLNRAKEKAESLAEKFLMWQVGLPTPFTALTVAVELLCVGYVVGTVLKHFV